jgi:poly(A) polymerase Pap1
MKLEDIKVGQKYKSKLFKSIVYLGIGFRDASKKKLVIIDAAAQEEIGLITVYNSDQKSSSKLFFDNLYEI